MLSFRMYSGLMWATSHFSLWSFKLGIDETGPRNNIADVCLVGALSFGWNDGLRRGFCEFLQSLHMNTAIVPQLRP